MRPGDVLANRFRIERPAASGGMGAVYRAQELGSGEVVAIKVLHAAAPVSDELRFAREARVLSDLRHPGIVRYVDCGRTPEGKPYLVMEWLEGETLGERLSQSGLGEGESVTLALSVAQGLAAAHARGVVHRDIKPQNLFLPDGDIRRIKLIDFGLARRRLESGALTRTNVFLGTPAYTAPEQARGSREVGPPADIFSLGCVLFECLTGKPPFLGDHVMAILAKILFEDAPHPSELNAAISLSLGNLVARMLSKDPSRRPSDGARLAAEIEDLDIAPLSHQAGFTTMSDALTTGELRLVSVILVGPVSTGSPVGGPASNLADVGSAPTLDAEEVPAAFEQVRALTAELGARVEFLLDGSVIAALSSRGGAMDQAIQAARAALSIRAALPEAPIVLATGRGLLDQRLLVGEVLERSVEILRTRSPASAQTRRERLPILLDEVSAGLLDARFEIAVAAGALELVGARAVEDGVRTLLGKPTPYVGRSRELAVLDRLFRDCIAEPMAQAALVTGAPGMGKSRLRHEFLRSIQKRGAESAFDVEEQVWIAHGDAIRASSPFGMVAQLLRSAAGLLEGEPLDVRRTKLRARIAERVRHADAARVTEFLGELVGTPFPDHDSVQLRAARHDPALMSDQMKRAFQDFLAAECQARPVLIVLEDLHWGDLPSVQLVEAALSTLQEQPLMALGLARPEVHETFPKLWFEINVQQITLGKLLRKASEQLARQVLGEGADSEKIAKVVNQADGNALYLEELLRAVVEGAGESLPGTVLAMVQARLEALDPQARQVLRAASIFGEVFWEGGLIHMLGSVQDSRQVADWLALLTERELLTRRAESRFQDQQEYTFRHALFREAAYGMLTEHNRALGHRLAGAWLERMGEQDANALAEHFERGGDKEQAVVFYCLSAEQAREAHNGEVILARAARAVACGAEGEMLGVAERLRGDAYFWRGQLAEAEASDSAAMRLLPRGSPRWFNAVAGVAVAAHNRGNHERLVEVVEELKGSSTVAPAALASEVVVIAQVVRMLLRSGMLELADPLFERLTRAADEVAGEPLALGHLHSAFASRALFAGDPAAARAALEVSIESFARAGYVAYVLARRMSRSIALIQLGAPREAEEELRKVLGEAERVGVGFDRLSSVTRCKLGLSLAQQGKLGEAREIEERAIAPLARAGDRWYTSEAHSYLARILCQMGHLDEAEAEARRAVELCEMAPRRCAALGALADVLLRKGRPREAYEAASAAMAILERLGGIEEDEALVRVVLAEALHENGDIEGARRAISAAEARLARRAAMIADTEERARFLEQAPENARTLAFSRRYSARSAR